MSDTLQGVTLEVFGEASPGPLTEALRRNRDRLWSTLGEYLDHLQHQGITPNVAAFVGAAHVREYVLGHDNRPPTDDELDEMKRLVAQAMEEGALGFTAALIYPPGMFAETDEPIALAKVASKKLAGCTAFIFAARGTGGWRPSTRRWRSRGKPIVRWRSII